MHDSLAFSERAEKPHPLRLLLAKASPSINISISSLYLLLHAFPDWCFFSSSPSILEDGLAQRAALEVSLIDASMQKTRGAIRGKAEAPPGCLYWQSQAQHYPTSGMANCNRKELQDKAAMETSLHLLEKKKNTLQHSATADFLRCKCAFVDQNPALQGL